MSITGVCQVCESAEARHSCQQCGRTVCDDHYDREIAVCEVCATDLRRGGGNDSGGGPTGRGGHDVDDDDILR
jgi:ribosomal protein L37AE/L43A